MRHTKAWINTQDSLGGLIFISLTDWHVPIPTALNTFIKKITESISVTHRNLDYRNHSNLTLRCNHYQWAIKIFQLLRKKILKKEIITSKLFTEEHLQATHPSESIPWEPRKRYGLESGREGVHFNRIAWKKSLIIQRNRSVWNTRL